MSVATRGQECAPRPDYAMQLVFERLPLEEQVFTVSALGRARWCWGEQPLHQLLERCRQLEGSPWRDYPRYSLRRSAHAVPLWLGQQRGQR